jgi:hypothetical protein
VGLGVLVPVDVGEGATVEVGDGRGLGLLVGVAVARGVSVAVGGTNWEITGHWPIGEEPQAAARRSIASRRSARPLRILKLEPPLNGLHDVAIR